jgi:hypothetical protein
MGNRRKIFTGSLLALFWLALPLFADDNGTNQAFYITFQVPGAFFPRPVAINNSLTVAGDGSNGFEPVAFVRDVFGRSAIIGVDHCFRTWATGINAVGTVVGFCQNPLFHGYTRDVDGTVTIIDCPASFFTNANSINAAGAVTGSCGGGVAGSRALCAPSREPSLSSTLREPTVADQPPSVSTREGRSLVFLPTRATSNTASCAIPTERLPRSISLES